MAWGQRSRRRAELPPNWATLRLSVLERDGYQCQIRGPRCALTANEVDHVGDRHDHRPEALRSACHPCHAQHTAEQAQAARPSRPSRIRPVDKHPGLF